MGRSGKSYHKLPNFAHLKTKETSSFSEERSDILEKFLLSLSLKFDEQTRTSNLMRADACQVYQTHEKSTVGVTSHIRTSSMS